MGLYIIVNGTTGATMIGSTAAGLSAAGTVGIIGGTAGATGTAAAIVSAPVTIVVSVLTALGVSALEGGCFFADERITGYDEVLALLEKVAPGADPKLFQLRRVGYGRDFIVMDFDGSGLQPFDVSKLYIVNGELMHRDWFFNTSLGHIVVAVEQETEN